MAGGTPGAIIGSELGKQAEILATHSAGGATHISQFMPGGGGAGDNQSPQLSFPDAAMNIFKQMRAYMASTAKNTDKTPGKGPERM